MVEVRQGTLTWMVVVEVRQGTLTWIAVEQEEDEEEEDEEEDQATDIKSNNPHLAGGEIHQSAHKSMPTGPDRRRQPELQNLNAACCKVTSLVTCQKSTTTR